MTKKIIIILIILTVLLPFFALAREGLQVREKIKGLAGEKMESAKEGLFSYFENFWNKKILPVWQRGHDWAKENIWLKAEKWAKSEIEKRKEYLKESLEQEKEKLKQGLMAEASKTYQSLKLKILSSFKPDQP